MLCYKDKTFCTFGKECKNGRTCTSVLTEQEEKRGKEWSKFYGQEDLIARYTSKPECFIDKKLAKSEYMKNYFKNNPDINAWACHNGERKARGLKKISKEEFKDYRNIVEKRKDGRVRSGRGYNPINIWERYKKFKKVRYKPC